jgi:hypothetical protein
MYGEQTERKYVSEPEAYEVFVGQITPQEFVAPFHGNVDDAISNLINNWEYDGNPPSWLRDALCRYVTEKLQRSLCSS